MFKTDPSTLNAALAAMGITARIPEGDPSPLATFQLLHKAAFAAAAAEAKRAAADERRIAKLSPSTAGTRAGLLTKVRLMQAAGLSDARVLSMLPKGAKNLVNYGDAGALALAQAAAPAEAFKSEKGRPTAAAIGAVLLRGLLALTGQRQQTPAPAPVAPAG
jgi:hypothetical protein